MLFLIVVVFVLIFDRRFIYIPAPRASLHIYSLISFHSFIRHASSAVDAGADNGGVFCNVDMNAQQPPGQDQEAASNTTPSDGDREKDEEPAGAPAPPSNGTGPDLRIDDSQPPALSSNMASQGATSGNAAGSAENSVPTPAIFFFNEVVRLFLTADSKPCYVRIVDITDDGRYIVAREDNSSVVGDDGKPLRVGQDSLRHLEKGHKYYRDRKELQQELMQHYEENGDPDL